MFATIGLTILILTSRIATIMVSEMSVTNNNKEENNKKKTFIVRIYRLDSLEPHGIVGVVESINNGYKRAFLTAEDLFNILLEEDSFNKKG